MTAMESQAYQEFIFAPFIDAPEKLPGAVAGHYHLMQNPAQRDALWSLTSSLMTQRGFERPRDVIYVAHHYLDTLSKIVKVGRRLRRAKQEWRGSSSDSNPALNAASTPEQREKLYAELKSLFESLLERQELLTSLILDVVERQARFAASDQATASSMAQSQRELIAGEAFKEDFDLNANEITQREEDHAFQREVARIQREWTGIISEQRRDDLLSQIPERSAALDQRADDLKSGTGKIRAGDTATLDDALAGIEGFKRDIAALQSRSGVFGNLTYAECARLEELLSGTREGETDRARSLSGQMKGLQGEVEKLKTQRIVVEDEVINLQHERQRQEEELTEASRRVMDAETRVAELEAALEEARAENSSLAHEVQSLKESIKSAPALEPAEPAVAPPPLEPEAAPAASGESTLEVAAYKRQAASALQLVDSVQHLSARLDAVSGRQIAVGGNGGSNGYESSEPPTNGDDSADALHSLQAELENERSAHAEAQHKYEESHKLVERIREAGARAENDLLRERRRLASALQLANTVDNERARLDARSRLDEPKGPDPAALEAELEALRKELELTTKRSKNQRVSLHELGELLEEREAELKAIKESVAEQQAASAELESAKAEHQSTIEEHLAAIAERDAALESLQQEHQALSAKLNELEATDEEVGKAEAEIKRLEQELDAKRSEVNQLHRSIKDREHTSEKLDKEAADKEAQIAALQEDIARLDESLKASDNDKSAMAEQIKKSSELLEEREGDLIALTNEYNAKVAEADRLTTTLDKLRIKLGEISESRRLAEANGDDGQAAAALSAKEAEIIAIKSQQEQSERQTVKLQGLMKNRERELQDLSSHLAAKEETSGLLQESVSKLTQTLRVVKDEKDALEAAAEEKDQKLSKLHQQQSSLKQRLNESIASLRSTRAEAAVLTQQLAASASASGRFARSASSNSNKFSALSSRLVAVDDERQQLEHEAKRFAEQLEEMKSRGEKLLGDKRELEDRLAKVESAHKSSASILQDARRRTASLETSHAMLASRSVELKNKVNELTDERNKLLSDLFTASAEREEAKEELNAARESIGKAEKDVAQLESQNRALQQNIEEIKHQLLSESAQADELEKERDDLLASITTLERELSETKEANQSHSQELESQIQSLEQQIAGISSERDQAKSRADELEVELDHAKDSLQEESWKLRGEADAARKELESERSKLKEASDRNREEISARDKQIQQLETRRDELRERIRNEEEQKLLLLESLERSEEDHKRQHASLIEELDQLHADNKSLHEQVRGLSERTQSLRRANVDTASRNAEHHQKFVTTQRKLYELESGLADANAQLRQAQLVDDEEERRNLGSRAISKLARVIAAAEGEKAAGDVLLNLVGYKEEAPAPAEPIIEEEAVDEAVPAELITEEISPDVESEAEEVPDEAVSVDDDSASDIHSADNGEDSDNTGSVEHST